MNRETPLTAPERHINRSTNPWTIFGSGAEGAVLKPIRGDFSASAQNPQTLVVLVLLRQTCYAQLARPFSVLLTALEPTTPPSVRRHPFPNMCVPVIAACGRHRCLRPAHHTFTCPCQPHSLQYLYVCPYAQGSQEGRPQGGRAGASPLQHCC